MGMYSHQRSLLITGLLIGFFATTLLASNNKLIPVTKYGEYGSYIYLAPNGDVSSEKKIIDDNDLLSVFPDGENLPKKYQKIMNAFGNISMGCTATHIGGGVAITAGHCFRSNECSETYIHWGDRKGIQPYEESKCQKIIRKEYSAGKLNLDYAFFTVDPIPDAKVKVDFTSELKVGTPITIFGHPQKRPLEWSGECTAETHKNFNVKYKPTNNAFTHQCDTQGGNSGSTVINTQTMKVVGIHDGGIAPWNYGTKLKSTVTSKHRELENCLNNDGGAACFDK